MCPAEEIRVERHEEKEQVRYNIHSCFFSVPWVMDLSSQQVKPKHLPLLHSQRVHYRDEKGV